jgi:hypothetical protein
MSQTFFYQVRNYKAQTRIYGVANICHKLRLYTPSGKSPNSEYYYMYLAHHLTHK